MSLTARWKHSAPTIAGGAIDVSTFSLIDVGLFCHSYVATAQCTMTRRGGAGGREGGLQRN